MMRAHPNFSLMLSKTSLIIGLIAIFAIIAYAAVYSSRNLGPLEPSQLPAIIPTETSLPESPKDIREAVVAGQFYPSDAYELGKSVERLVWDAELPETDGRARIILTPHAGHKYSGEVAAPAFKTLVGSGYSRVILVGRSHDAQYLGVAADTHDVWEVPLGEVGVDQEFVAELVAADDIVRKYRDPHQQEHSLEVLIPFLTEALGSDIEIVPLLFGTNDYAEAEDLADALGELMDDDTVVVISSDLSHYPAYEDANELDSQVIKAILTGDSDRLGDTIKTAVEEEVEGVSTLACAEVAVAFGMMLAEDLGLEPYLLKYANSGDVAPDKQDSVVGYAAIGFYGPEAETDQTMLSEAEQEIALTVARKTLERAFEEREYLPPESSGILGEERGVFVTLEKNEDLRGCIGVFDPTTPLTASIHDMALSAAFEDPRFGPLEEDELDEINIEVSVLSPLDRVYDPDLITLGVHGVSLRQGDQSGTFLPQVAIEQEWDRETFLSQLCLTKAGLDADCWQDPETELYTFTAQVFEESEANK